MGMLNVPDDEPIEARMVTRAIEGAQRKVEGHNFDVRKHLLEYDDVMNQQRTSIYRLRKEVLEGENVESTTLDMLGETTSLILDTFANEQTKSEEWDLNGLNTALVQQFGIHVGLEVSEPNELTQRVSQAVKEAYDRQKQTLGAFFVQIQKMVLLETIDTKWKEHLAQIDHLKEGINLRAYAQKDPLIEYKKEAFLAFEKVNQLIRSEVIEKIMKVQIVSEERARSQMEREVLPDSDYNYQGGEGVDPFSFAPEGAPVPPSNASNAFGEPPLSGDSSGRMAQGGGRSLNRAERRRRARSDKKARR